MDSNWHELNFRPAQPDDAPIVLELMKECETAEYGEPDADLEDLLHDWDSTDLARDSWLVFGPNQDLVGYGIVMPWFHSLRYDFFVAPSIESPALGLELLQRCDRRSQEIHKGSPGEIPTSITCYIAHVNQRDRASLEMNGFKLDCYHFQMQITLTDQLPGVEWSAGIEVRNTIPGKDDRTIHELIERAFERPGRQPTSFEDWSNAMLREDIFDPSLWFLAFDGSELVGACLCFEYPQEGWVRQLGVHPRWQGKGLGKALLRQAFTSFQARGYDKVGLTVNAQNASANIFYQKAGMQPIRQFEQHEKNLLTS